MLQAFYRDPLQRCPAVRRVPLLTIVHRRGHQAARFEQLFFHRAGGAVSLFVAGNLHIERKQRGSGELRMDLAFLPVIVRVPALLAVPQVTVNRRLTFFCPVCKGLCPIVLFVQAIGGRQGFFQVEHQAVQIYRGQLGGTDGSQIMSVGEPARTEVPARGGSGTQLAVHLGLVALRRFTGRRNIIHPGFRPRHVARIPVAIQQRTVGQLDHPFAGTARCDAVAVCHPVVVFFLQLRQIAGIGFVAFMGCQQIDHQAKERRL